MQKPLRVVDLPAGPAEAKRLALMELVAGRLAAGGRALLTAQALALAAPGLPALHQGGPLEIRPAETGCFLIKCTEEGS